MTEPKLFSRMIILNQRCLKTQLKLCQAGAERDGES